MEIFVELLKAVAPGLLVGAVLSYWNKRQTKRDSRMAEAEKTHVKSESVKLALLLAGAKLSYAAATAIKRGSSNGETEDALEEYEKALSKFREFERERMSEL